MIAKCLEYDPECRYQTAHEVIDALHERRWEIIRTKHRLRIALTPRGIFIMSALALLLLSLGGGWWHRTAKIQTLSAIAQPWYDRGMMALRDGTYLQATLAFTKALDLDKRYVLTHARLAEAWAELDSTGLAQTEMLAATAPEAQDTMPALDRKYVDAVRATLIRDYSAAAQDYEEIVRQLPGDRKADGYVDLGRAYEKAGKVKETIASYETAAKMKPEDPAPFVHLGIWKSRQRNPVGAEAAFKRAEELYHAGSNQEGLAEVAYQRGYAANEAADSEHAREYLEQSLAIARQIDSPQLEARTLSQLSSVAYNDDKDDLAIDYANQVIQIADTNGLEYWKADGKMRLGNAYLDKEDFAKAESSSQEALSLARHNQHPRVKAAAEFTLASIRDQEGGRPDEQIVFAQDALKYYRDFGFMNRAAASAILVIRAHEAKGDFTQALQTGTELIQVADQTHSQVSMENAQEAVGSANLGLQDYPAALAHFQIALKTSQVLHENEAYQEIHCADALWRIGRYQEAEEMLAEIPPDAMKRNDIATYVDGIGAQINLSQGKYGNALSVSRRALLAFPKMPANEIAEFEKIEALSQAQLGQLEQAQHEVDQLLAFAQEKGDEGLIAESELTEANVLLRVNSPEKAMSLAQSAYSYFSAKGEKESEWLSLFYLAIAAKGIGDLSTSAHDAQKALDTLASLEQSWGASVFDHYIARPDYKIVLRELTKLKAA